MGDGAALVEVVSAAVDPQPLSAPGYGAALAQTLLALAGVCALAWWALRQVARRGVGGGGHVKVLDRVALDARRSVYLLRVGGRVLLVGGGDQGLALLAELRADELRAPADAPADAKDLA